MAAKARPAAADPEQVRMSFSEHLDELRKRLFRSMLVVGAVFCLAWLVFPEQVEVFFMRPHLQAADRLAHHDPPVVIERRLMVQSPLEEIFYLVKASLLLAVVIGFPFVLYQLWAFVAAGLYPHEKKAVMRFVPWSIVLGLAGMSFGYLALIPLMLEYLYSMPDQAYFVQAYRLEYYFSLFLLLTVALAAIFQLPVLMMGLHAVGIGSVAVYSKYRRHFIVGAFIVAAVLTPPEPVSQVLMAVPTVLLFELGLLVLRVRERRQRAAAKRAA
jgi:sec-independent protein translocase protein TatC